MSVDLDHLHPSVMRPRLDAFLADPQMQGLGVYVVSGFRTPEYQKVLYDQALQQYGSAAEAGKWVAPPWHSDHGPVLADDGHRVAYGPNQGGVWGGAVDIGIPGWPAVKGQWDPKMEAVVHGVAAQHGLFFPYSWEDWHMEPIANWVPPKQNRPPEEDVKMYSLIPSWAPFRPNGLAPVYELIIGKDNDGNPTNRFNVLSYNDAPLDRVDGVYGVLWFMHEETSGPVIGIQEHDGVVVVTSRPAPGSTNAGVYRIADKNSQGRPK